MGVEERKINTREGLAFQRKTSGKKILDVILPVLLTIVAAVGIGVSELIYAGKPLLGVLITHAILVAVAILGIITSKLSLVEAGITPLNLRYSFYTGLYLSTSLCGSALASIGILNLLGLASLNTSRLNVYTLAEILVVHSAVVALCEELFFRGYVQGSLNRSIGSSASPIVSGVIFGVIHLGNYVNPFTGRYSLDVGAVMWVLACCLVGIYLGLLRRRCGDIYCPTLFHGFLNFTSNVMIILECPRRISLTALGTGWVVSLAITYILFKKPRCVRS